MSPTYDDSIFQAIAQKITRGSRVLETRALSGGISAEMYAMTLQRVDGTQETVVIRRHGPIDLAANPNIAADEFRLLETLHQIGIPVPQPILLDTSCEILPTPYLVQELVQGTPDFAPADLDHHIDQIAQQLARIHQVDIQAHDVRYLPHINPLHDRIFSKMPDSLDESINERAIREVLIAAWPWGQSNADVLLHGDYWLGNILMRDGRLLAIIDWEDAKVGDPLYDLGNARLEMLWSFGETAMHQFTKTYLAHMPALDTTRLPYWDLCTTLRPAGRLDDWAESPEQAQHWREGIQWFVQQAVAAIKV
ncbi:MAG: phosphotransferase [Anaerolineae bacterium]|nr:phosphotransferase [Anaerolineae bacterium]